MDAGQGFELADQLPGFLLGDELGALHRVHQQLELRQLEAARGQMVAHVPPVLLAEDLQAEFCKLFKVLVEGLALGVDAAGLQLRGNLLQGQGVALVRLLGEDFDKIQHFQFLVFTCGHGASLAFPDPDGASIAEKAGGGKNRGNFYGQHL